MLKERRSAGRVEGLEGRRGEQGGIRATASIKDQTESWGGRREGGSAGEEECRVKGHVKAGTGEGESHT